MKTRHLAGLFCFGILSAAYFTSAAVLRAQAPPGPLPRMESKDPVAAAKPSAPPIEPRTTILGGWKLNREDSDDARKKMQSARGAGNGGRRGMGGGSGRGGGYGGQRGMRGRESDEDRERLQELLTPAKAVTLSMTGAEVDLVDDQNRKRAFMTDTRKLQKSKDEQYQEIAAKWEGNRLVSEEKNPRGGKLSRTFELSEDGRQLYETIHMTFDPGNTALVIRYVYDIPSPTRQ
jgi:hypothetical protein